MTFRSPCVLRCVYYALDLGSSQPVIGDQSTNRPFDHSLRGFGLVCLGSVLIHSYTFSIGMNAISSSVSRPVCLISDAWIPFVAIRTRICSAPVILRPIRYHYHGTEHHSLSFPTPLWLRAMMGSLCEHRWFQ